MYVECVCDIENVDTISYCTCDNGVVILSVHACESLVNVQTRYENGFGEKGERDDQFRT